MNRRRPLLALLVAGALLAGPVAVPAAAQQATEPAATATPPEDLGLIDTDRITVGSDLNFAPFEFIADGEARGFDIDMSARSRTASAWTSHGSSTPASTRC